MKIQLCFLLSLISVATMAQLSEPLSFMSHSTPIPAKILTHKEAQKSKAPAALVRLSNGKLAYMVRQNGQLKPFFIKAIETGYWDTRYETTTNYDSVFADMRQMGANTAYVMLHWEDIERADNHFDFSFADSLVNAAKRQQLKIGWVLFLHAQGQVPSMKPETAWTFHLDDRDNSNYTMQWPKRNGKILTSIKELINNNGIRPLHVYGHKEIFYRIRRMLYKLAVHYKQDETVIGVQVGNEEGFSFLDESDFNPVTTELYSEWKLKTNKTDYSQFKKEAMDWWWQQFTSAYHEGDPYKILSFNLDAALPEAGVQERIKMTGTSAGTYADGNLDAIGTMLYKRGHQALLGLDDRYSNSYCYKLPILVPSEIGIGIFNKSILFRHYVINTLERGGQGFGVYCYGEVRKELVEKRDERTDLTQMLSAISANEDIIYAGLPGPGLVVCATDSTSAQVSHLNVKGEKSLAMVYFPEGRNDPDSPLNKQEFCLRLKCTALKTGKYNIDIYQNGSKCIQQSVVITESTPQVFEIPKMKREDVLFIAIR